MFKDEFLEKILMNEEMRTIPIGCQSTAIHVIEKELEEMVKKNEYATISELLH